MANSPKFPETINSYSLKITSNEGTGTQTLFTAGANGARVDHLGYFCTEAGSTLNVLVGGEILFPLPVEAGVYKDILASMGRTNLMLKAGETVEVTMSSALSVDQSMVIRVEGGDY